MLVLIDESGDPGFKIAKGSTPYFVVALVIFHDTKQAEACSFAIGEARRQLGYKSEFKFSKTNDAGREAFFKAVAPFHFEVRSLVVQKALVYSDHLRGSDEAFYNYFIKQLLAHCAVLQNARVKIDGSGDREFKRRLERYLRKGVGDGRIASVKFAESSRDNLIQLADMAVGAIARSYRDDGKGDHQQWRRMLKAKHLNCWEFK